MNSSPPDGAPVRFSLMRFARAARKNMLHAFAVLPDAPLATPGLGVPLLVIQDTRAAREILVTQADAFTKPGLVTSVISRALGPNLFTLEGDDWLRHRQPIAPVFGVDGLDDLATIMTRVTAATVAGWEPGTIDIQDAITDLTMAVACQALLGADPDDSDLLDSIRGDFDTLVDWIGQHLTNPRPLPGVLRTRTARTMDQARHNLRHTIKHLVDDQRGRGDFGPDILGRLLNAQQSGSDLTDDEIIDECIGFLFAGHETTAATLTWALYELALNGDVQHAVALEGEALHPETDSLYDVSESLGTTASVIEEALRLYPAGISIARTAKQTTKIHGHRVRKGTLVMIAVYNLQRSASAWDQPHTFEPGRQGHDLGAGLTDGFIPFGLGPRRCLGTRFARTEMRLALPLICANWKLTYNKNHPPTPVVEPSLRAAGGMPITITPRESTDPSAM